MRHFAIERRKSLKIVACQSPCLRAQRRIEIGTTVELHLRQKHGLASPHRKWICPRRRAMQDQRTDVGELLQYLSMASRVITLEGLRAGRRAAIPHEIRHHNTHPSTQRTAASRRFVTLTHRGGTTRSLAQHRRASSAIFSPPSATIATSPSPMWCIAAPWPNFQPAPRPRRSTPQRTRHPTRRKTGR